MVCWDCVVTRCEFLYGFQRDRPPPLIFGLLCVWAKTFYDSRRGNDAYGPRGRISGPSANQSQGPGKIRPLERLALCDVICLSRLGSKRRGKFSSGRAQKGGNFQATKGFDRDRDGPCFGDVNFGV